MHLRQPGFTYSACGPFTKNKKRSKKSKETGYSRYIFQHYMTYGDFKVYKYKNSRWYLVNDNYVI